MVHVRNHTRHLGRKSSDTEKEQFERFWRESVNRFGVGRYSERIKWISNMMNIPESRVRELQMERQNEMVSWRD